ncbi:hypothetical protein [Paenibacillus sp. YAF4_2]|uniref:hypothetical protein n=1 Tax=Paenibacillus sp. YAF4_2 TaxID=3233085 RepID=UPI003F94356C
MGDAIECACKNEFTTWEQVMNTCLIMGLNPLNDITAAGSPNGCTVIFLLNK